MRRFQFVPGDGQSYDIMYGKVEGEGYLLVWLSKGGSGGVAFRFSGSYVAASYLAEKMGLHPQSKDTLALLAFLNTQGHSAEVGGGFDEAGRLTTTQQPTA
jgi:hypothetical protein